MAGGSATGSIIDSGGYELVSNGGTASGTQVEDGSQVVYSGGLAVAATVSGFVGYQSVLSGGTVSATVVETGGDEIISPGAIVNPFTLHAGGLVGVAGIKANGAHVNSSGNLAVTSDGVVVDTILLSAGSSDAYGFEVITAGTDFGSSGGEFVVALTDTPGGAVAISGFDQSVDVASGQIDSGATLSGYAFEKVEAGGQSLAAHVNSLGIQVVSSGGVVSGSVIASGAYEIVYSGAQDTNLTLEPGAFLYAYGVSGASAYVNASNQLVVASGGR